MAENEGSGGSYPLDVGLTCAPLHIRGAKPLLFPTYKWRTLLFKFSYNCLVQIPCYFVEKIHKTQKKVRIIYQLLKLLTKFGEWTAPTSRRSNFTYVWFRVNKWSNIKKKKRNCNLFNLRRYIVVSNLIPREIPESTCNNTYP